MKKINLKKSIIITISVLLLCFISGNLYTISKLNEAEKKLELFKNIQKCEIFLENFTANVYIKVTPNVNDASGYKEFQEKEITKTILDYKIPWIRKVIITAND